MSAGRSGSKVATLGEAIASHVHDGDTLAIEGFTHLISFAAGHEVIRQGRRGLTLVRLTPDLVYDQMVAAGCASRLVFSWLGNPGGGSLHAIRRAVEGGELEIEEYSHFGMVGRYLAGAAGRGARRRSGTRAAIGQLSRSESEVRVKPRSRSAGTMILSDSSVL